MNTLIDCSNYPKKTLEQLEAEIADHLPDWAIARAHGELVEGAQLPTRDGRLMGNAHILKMVPGLKGAPSLNYLVLTDAGNTLVFSENELRSRFYPPEWVSAVPDIIRKFWRHDQEPIEQSRIAQQYGLTA